MHPSLTMKERNYEALVAGMRERPTIFDAEETIRKDYPLKLPDRRYITLWNTPEISQFRGVQESLDEEAERRHNAAIQQLEIQKTARDMDVSTPDMQFVADELQRQRQSNGAVLDAISGLRASHEQTMRGMQEETTAELNRLAAAQNEAANRARIAETAMSSLRDTVLEDRDRLRQIAEQQGAEQVPQHIDNSVTNHHNTIVQNIDERSVHNQVMQIMHTHSAQFGAFMEQQRISQEQMMERVFQLVRQHHAQQPPMPPPSGAGSSNDAPAPPMDTDTRAKRGAAGQGGRGAPSMPTPPPGPDVVMDVIRTKRESSAQGGRDDPPAQPSAPALPAPKPEPVPTAPAVIPGRTARSRTPGQGRRGRSQSVKPLPPPEDPPKPAAPLPPPAIDPPKPNVKPTPPADMPKATAKARSRSRQPRARSEDVQFAGLQMNTSHDINFWKQQSANELRSQITLRKGARGNWAVKTKAQLVAMVEDMIADGSWGAPPTAATSSTPAVPAAKARSRSRQVAWTTGMAPDLAMPPKPSGASAKATPKKIEAAAVAKAVGTTPPPAKPQPKRRPRVASVPTAGPQGNRPLSIKRVAITEGSVKKGTLKPKAKARSRSRSGAAD